MLFMTIVFIFHRTNIVYNNTMFCFLKLEQFCGGVYNKSHNSPELFVKLRTLSGYYFSARIYITLGLIPFSAMNWNFEHDATYFRILL